MTDTTPKQPVTHFIDVTIIKRELLRFIFFIMVAALVVFFSSNKIKETNTHQVNLSLSISRSQLDLKDRLENLAIYQSVHTEFADLYDADTHVDKLRWIEHLDFQAQSLKIPSLSYSIKSQSPVSNDDGRDFVALSTPISIKLDLIHEGQLLDLFAATDHAKLGLFSVEHCVIAIKAPTLGFRPKTDNLQAECLIDWLNVARAPILSESEL